MIDERIEDEKEYIIFYKGSDGKLNYVYEVNQGSTYTTEVKQNAMFLDDKDCALSLAKWLMRRQKSSGGKVYKVMAIVTKSEVVEDD